MSAKLKWNNRRAEYRAGNQRVARRALLEAVDSIVADTQAKLRALSQDYVDGRINLAHWQIEFTNTIRAAHTLSAGIAMGGKRNMTDSDWGRVGAKLRVQYERLNRFALQIEAGGKVNMGRVDLYARAVRSTFINSERLRHEPFDLARWVRSKVESCGDCIAQAARGLQPVASFPPLGSLSCFSNCGCRLEYAA